MKRRAIRHEPLFFERNPDRVRRQGFRLPPLDVPAIDPADVFSETAIRKAPADTPDVTEMEVVTRGLGVLGFCEIREDEDGEQEGKSLFEGLTDGAPAPGVQEGRRGSV